jgi:hypothetical protein
VNARYLKSRLSEALIEQSGLEQQRAYLGMSQIGRCPRFLYRMMLEGRSEDELSPQRHWFCWTGYLHEAAVIDLLNGTPEKRNIEVVAEFDDRYRGHVDYEMGDIIGPPYIVEIKSVSWRKFGHILKTQRPDWLHFCQVQAYMHHGQWPRAFIVYLARDVPFREWRGLPIWVFDVKYDVIRGMALDEKARYVLARVDSGDPPKCDCGKCE